MGTIFTEWLDDWPGIASNRAMAELKAEYSGIDLFLWLITLWLFYGRSNHSVCFPIGSHPLHLYLKLRILLSGPLNTFKSFHLMFSEDSEFFTISIWICFSPSLICGLLPKHVQQLMFWLVYLQLKHKWWLLCCGCSGSTGGHKPDLHLQWEGHCFPSPLLPNQIFEGCMTSSFQRRQRQKVLKYLSLLPVCCYKLACVTH